MADTEYISKEAALACFSDWIDRYGHEHTADEMVEYQRIEELPAADVVEVVRGEWIAEKDRSYHWNCSQCGYVVGPIKMDCKFCPNCGANMRGEHCSQLRDGTEGG